MTVKENRIEIDKDETVGTHGGGWINRIQIRKYIITHDTLGLGFGRHVFFGRHICFHTYTTSELSTKNDEQR